MERLGRYGNDKSNPTTVTMSDSNKNLTVNFEPRFSLIISNQLVIGASGKLGRRVGVGKSCPGDDDKYAKDTRVTLTASPIPGYGWKSWSGTRSDTSNPTTVTITSDKHLAVTFELRFLLTINNQTVTGSSLGFTGGSVSVNPAPGADGRYAQDTTAFLTAMPAAGYRFDHWSGDASGNVTSVTITMNANKNATATFIKVYNLATSVKPAQGGSVSTAGGTYDEGTSISLTATPAAGYRFDHWTGDASGNVTSIAIIMNADKSVTATFIKVYTLTVSSEPAQGGSVSPAGALMMRAPALS